MCQIVVSVPQVLSSLLSDLALKAGCCWYKLPGKLSLRNKKNGMMWEFFPPGQSLEGMIHPRVVAIRNYQEGVDPSSVPQEFNHSPDVLCTFDVRFFETGGIFNQTLGPICDPPLVFLVQVVFEPIGNVPTRKTIAKGRLATCQPRTPAQQDDGFQCFLFRRDPLQDLLLSLSFWS